VSKNVGLGSDCVEKLFSGGLKFYHTIMSYLSETSYSEPLPDYLGGTSAFKFAPSWHGNSPRTPMLYDVVAIQTKYGADFSPRASDTTHGFNTNTTAQILNAIRSFQSARAVGL
jgi:hypothetical protein